MSVESMQRGHGGRIEDAFAKCKEKGEAAFVTFVTAGFPTKEGKKREIFYEEHYVDGCSLVLMFVKNIGVSHMYEGKVCWMVYIKENCNGSPPPTASLYVAKR